MAHFAQIKNETVSDVIVISNEVLQNKDFPESEKIGQEFIASLGLTGEWKQASYNGTFRKRFAGLGYEYNRDLDAFIEPKPYDSWILENETASWVAPIPYPSEDGDWIWSESSQQWIE